MHQGSNDRGLSRRKGPVEVRGALSYETVADNIVKVGPEKLSAMFNGAIRCLAKQRMFPKQIDASLDATGDEATPTYKTDAGGDVPRVRREKRPEVRGNKHARKVKVTVFSGERFGIFRNYEVMLLAGVSVRERALMGESAQTVLARCRSRTRNTS